MGTGTGAGCHPSPCPPVLVSRLSKHCALSKYLLRRIMRTFRRLSLSILYFLRNFKKVKFLFGTVTVSGRILFRCTLTV